jgi:hypothetical protein
MKILFLFFLLVNIAYFYSQMGDADAPSSAAILKQPPLPNGVEQLTLLRERGLGVTATRSIKENKPHSAAKKAVNKPVEKASGKPLTKPKPKVAKEAESRREEAAQKSREPACFTLGPFVKDEAAGRSAEAIGALGVDVNRRVVSQRIPKAHWVYLPPSNSYQSAKRMVAELQKKGLTDLFIMGKGSHANAISLGLFNSKNAAEERYQRVKRLGLKAELETQYRISKQTWLDMTVSGGQTATVATMSEMADGLPQAELSQRKCQ